MPNDDQMDRGVRRRISKACEPCRQRKAKCDGRLPCCSVCASHGGDPALCKYRNRTRVRTTHRASTPEVSRPATGPGEIARRNLGLPEVPQTEIESSTAQTTSEQDYCHNAFIGVNAAQSHAQLYYGSSSIFAFLQHIHQTFNDPDRRAIHPRDQDGGMERFRHRDRFFPSDSLGHGGQEAMKGQCLLLPEPLARLFLDNYLKSIHNLMPWLSAEQLIKMLDTVCSPDPEQQVQITNSDTAIILLSLACGASLVKHSRWIDVLVERALMQVPRLEMAINLRSVQISLLLAHVSVCRGRHNSAYIYLGSAARKAFAAGLHKDVDYQANQQNKAERAENLRLTFWSLAFLERWFSFWLGRPSTIDGVVISTPMPESSPLIRALAELSDIIIQAAHRMYDDVRPQLAKLWESGQHIRLDLLAFQRRMKSVLDFDLDNEVKLLEDNSVQVFLLVSSKWPPAARFRELTDLVFYHAWMITFRPFLVISIAWEQHREASTIGNRASDKTSLPIDMWWLPEACQIALEKSRRFIKLFATATSHSPIIRVVIYSFTIHIISSY